ncbi:MAG TPA: hypothetical protein PLC89_14885 [Haliscomenobacter sp.]|uniref:hypothetical protein n=1 Tax=Haliscomenobacter sp. TaxID=2717303 RepID=UPI002BED637C|nr:hypothetical protein [Haliscomenobacter sp.]HOY18589.1 hypothetical protein [Haliscomenobacter sp.]
MTQTHTRSNPFSFIVFLFFSASILSSAEKCSQSAPAVSSTELAKPVDELLFSHIKGLGDIYARDEIWKGYAYNSYHQYLVHFTEKGPDRAFVINPPTPPKGAIRLDANEGKGLVIYRYDLRMKEAYDLVFGPDGNGTFEFTFDIAGNNYYLQAYSDDLAEGSGDTSRAVSFSTHELFHRYQDNWENVPDSKQDFDNFPLTVELLELQILCQEIMKELPSYPSEISALKKILRQYVAIRSKEMELDPTPDQLIRNHELYQEQMEGSPKYIETMGNLQFFTQSTVPVHFSYSIFEFSIETKAEVRGMMGQSVYYGTGPSAIYILDRLGVNIEAMEQGKTPYDLAKAYLNMSKSERDQALREAKMIKNWSEIQAKAREWMALR